MVGSALVAQLLEVVRQPLCGEVLQGQGRAQRADHPIGVLGLVLAFGLPVKWAAIALIEAAYSGGTVGSRLQWRGLSQAARGAGISNRVFLVL